MGSRSMDMQCWKCGVQLKNVLLPFSRYEECSSCKADMHVCVSCKNFDPAVSDSCREDRADFVLDKDRANFCDYFKANPRAFKKTDGLEAREAKSKLAELFGEGVAVGAETKTSDSTITEADEVMAELKRLFGDK